MSFDQERRAAERVKVQLDVTFTTGNGTPMTGRVENISRHGVLLVAPVALVAKTHVRITFSDPDSKSLHTIEGEVVRSAPAGKFGVSFVETDATALAFIRSLVGAPA
jgi:c-di-GMP-binding flagellar brake protein YcgR